MNIFKKVLSGIKKKSVTFLSMGGSSWGGGGGMENFYDSLNLNTYKESLYLFIGVSMIRETVSSIPLEMHRIKNSNGDTEEVLTDPFLDLIGRPNANQTQKEFWKLSVAYYLLSGEAFWYLDRAGIGGVPTAMANMRPDHVEVMVSKDTSEIVAYKFYKSNGQTIIIQPEDVLHTKNIDPTNTSRGVGVIRPATQRIITEREASKYQSTTFKNSGRPDIAVFTDVDDLTEEQSEEARIKWDKIYGGNKKSAAGFFGGGVKSIQLLNASPKEMEYMGTMNFLRDDILSALRIPKAMLTSDDVNLANSKTARINYVKEACMPVLDAFIDVINNKYLTDAGEDKFIIYDNPVNEDRDILLTEAKELKQAGIITVNEAREIMNYPAMEGEDELVPSSGSMFTLSMKKKRLKLVAKTVLRKRKVLVLKFRAVDAIAKSLQEQKAFEVAREQNAVFGTKQLKEKYIKTFNDNIDTKAVLFKETIDVYNQGLLSRILENFEKLGVTETHIFDVSVELQETKGIFTPLLKKMYEKVGQDVMDSISIGFSNKASEHFYSADDILRELELRSEFFVTSMLNTDFKEMKEIIAQGLKDGLSVNQIGQSLRLYFDDMSVARAKTIARTETSRVISKATNDAYSQSNLVTGKQWLTSRDGKVRDTANTVNDHTINDGKIVNTNERFPNGEMYPGELTINCRCAIAPTV